MQRPVVARMTCLLCSAGALGILRHIPTWGKASTQMYCRGLLPRFTAGGRDAYIAVRRKESEGVCWIV
jgi:hypothetical protein